jgi:hypothetical protein
MLFSKPYLAVDSGFGGRATAFAGRRGGRWGQKVTLIAQFYRYFR